jgi:hypothetical protein
MRKTHTFVIGCSVLALTGSMFSGCTRVEVKKVQGDYTKGVRYYRPKPYLFISGDIASAGEDKAPVMSVFQDSPLEVKVAEKPANTSKVALASAKQPPDLADDDSRLPQGGDAGLETKPVKNLAAKEHVTLQKISMKLEYLPDFSEEYAINLKPGLGTGNFEFELENGWNLTSLNAETDQQTAEIIGSIGSLIGALSPAPGVLEKSAQNPSLNLAQQAPTPPATIYGSNVPFGFYEAVIACDPHGRKQLYGWRYVGFMPFQACPVEPRGAQQVCCDTQDIYGMVFVNGVLQFQKIHDIPTIPIDPTSPWPPQGEAVTSRDKAPQISRVSHKFQEKR